MNFLHEDFRKLSSDRQTDRQTDRIHRNYKPRRLAGGQQALIFCQVNYEFFNRYQPQVYAPFLTRRYALTGGRRAAYTSFSVTLLSVQRNHTEVRHQRYCSLTKTSIFHLLTGRH